MLVESLIKAFVNVSCCRTMSASDGKRRERGVLTSFPS